MEGKQPKVDDSVIMRGDIIFDSLNTPVFKVTPIEEYKIIVGEAETELLLAKVNILVNNPDIEVVALKSSVKVLDVTIEKRDEKIRSLEHEVTVLEAENARMDDKLEEHGLQ